MWKKIKEHGMEILMDLCFGAMAVAGIYTMAAYGIPLGEHERDMEMVDRGVQMALLAAGFIIFIRIAMWVVDSFFKSMENRYRDEQKYLNPEKWPLSQKRTVQKVLTKMSGRTFLLVWDILQGVILFSMALTCLCVEGADRESVLRGFVQVIFYGVIGHLAWTIFYNCRNYTDKMFQYTEQYFGKMDREYLLESIENDLKNELLCFLNMLVITEKYFIGWCGTEMAFHPIVIARKDIEKISFRVSDKSFGYGKRSVCPVVMCDMGNGGRVELFAGNRFQIDTMVKILEIFEKDKIARE